MSSAKKKPPKTTNPASLVDARVDAVLARVAAVKARAVALDHARVNVDDVDALVSGLGALGLRASEDKQHPITRVQTPPPLRKHAHARTVSVSDVDVSAVKLERDEAPAKRKRRVGLLYDDAMEMHEKEGHFEQPARHRVVVNEIKAEKLDLRCERLEAREATEAELTRAHTKEHVAFVDSAFDVDGEKVQVMTGEDVFGDDIFFTKHTAKGARMAAGTVAEACLAVGRGDVDRAFAVVRPPGHHAVCGQAMGFCFFNNAVVGARAVIETKLCERVLIIDWDVHHGNGIQDIVYEDESVMYVSLHRYGDGFYPGTGAVAEVGKGGTNVNVAWSEKGLGDADYLAAFDVVIEPVVKSFAPDLIIIAAGFDAADGDPLGGMMVSPTGYMHMTKRLIEIGTGRVVVALEGGYALRPLATCATATLRALLGDEPKPISSRSRPRKSSIKLCRELASLLAEHWPVLESDVYKNSTALIAKRATVVGAAREYPTGRRSKSPANSSSSASTAVGAVCTT